MNSATNLHLCIFIKSRAFVDSSWYKYIPQTSQHLDCKLLIIKKLSEPGSINQKSSKGIVYFARF